MCYHKPRGVGKVPVDKPLGGKYSVYYVVGPLVAVACKFARAQKQSEGAEMNNEQDTELVKKARSDLARALGAVVMNFAYLEAMLSYSIWVLIDISDEDIGKIVTAGKPFSALIDLFSALYRHRVLRVIQDEGLKVEAQISALTRLIQRMNEANERRNAVIHSTWASNTETALHLRFKFTAKRSKGLVRTEESMTADDIWEIAQFIGKVGDEVLKFSEPFHSPLFWLPHWQTWTVQWEDWQKSGELEQWLDWLSKLPVSAFSEQSTGNVESGGSQS
jgi:hypothetical protein